MNHSTPGLLVHYKLQSLPKLMSIESVMPSNHLILCRPLLLMPSNFPSIRVFSNESALRIRMLKLKPWYFGYLMRRTDSLEKTLMLRKTEGRRRRGWQRWDGWMASPTQRTWIWASSRRWWRTGKPGMLQSMGSQRVGHDWVTELSHKKLLIATQG